MIICIVGQSCAGKTTSCQYIEREWDIPFIEGSDVVWERYSESPDNGDILEYVRSEYKEKGKDTFAAPVIEKADKLEHNIKILCGFRTVEEIKYVLEYYEEEVLIIGIHANAMLRYQRKIKRDSNADLDYKEFIMKDFAEYDFGIAQILDENTDHIIVNEGTFERLYENIDNYLETQIDQ